MNDPNPTIIDLLRHGEPVGGRRYRGQTDDPLSENGWAEMHAAVGEARPWQAVVSSTLSRCAAFAEELAAQSALPLGFDARLVELGFGAWEGRTAEELRRNDPEILVRFWADPTNNRPPGAERLEDFRDRVVAAWEDILSAYTGKHVLVVAHAGVIRMIMRHVLDMPLDRLFRIKVPSAGLTRIQIDERNGCRLPSLIFHAGSL
jgi:alpha-ribazole phosphatase